MVMATVSGNIDRHCGVLRALQSQPARLVARVQGGEISGDAAQRIRQATAYSPEPRATTALSVCGPHSTGRDSLRASREDRQPCQVDPLLRG